MIARKIATLLCLVFEDVDEDPNDLTIQPIHTTQWYMETAEKLIAAVNEVLNDLPDVGETAEEIQFFMYEVGKKHFGEEKSELNLWFRCIYAIMFESRTGPRLGVFVHLYGKNAFINTLYDKMWSPRFPI